MLSDSYGRALLSCWGRASFILTDVYDCFVLVERRRRRWLFLHKCFFRTDARHVLLILNAGSVIFVRVLHSSFSIGSGRWAFSCMRALPSISHGARVSGIICGVQLFVWGYSCRSASLVLPAGVQHIILIGRRSVVFHEWVFQYIVRFPFVHNGACPFAYSILKGVPHSFCRHTLFLRILHTSLIRKENYDS